MAYPLGRSRIRLFAAQFTGGTISRRSIERCRKSVNSSGSRFTCITVIATLLIFMGSVFRQIRENPDVFRSLKVDEKMGTIYWDNGADIDPDVSYLRLTPAWMESEANESKAA